MNVKHWILSIVLCFLFACSQNDPPKNTADTEEAMASTDEEKDSENLPTSTPTSNVVSPDTNDLETNILDIRSKFQDTEKNLKTYTKKASTMENADGDIIELIGHYDETNQAKKIVREEAMGHGAMTTSYYMNNGATYFIFEQSMSEASVMGPITFKEKRIYLKNGNIIRFLEKEQTVELNENPTLSKIPNQDITSTLSVKSGNTYLSGLDEILKRLSTSSK